MRSCVIVAVAVIERRMGGQQQQGGEVTPSLLTREVALPSSLLSFSGAGKELGDRVAGGRQRRRRRGRRKSKSVAAGMLRHCVVEVWWGGIEEEGEQCADVGEEEI